MYDLPPSTGSGSPSALWSKTGRTLLYAVLAGAALQFAPGFDELHWVPDDPLAFVPRLFRPGVAFDTEADEALSTVVDDEALIALGPKVGGPAHHRPPRPTDADDGEGDAGAPSDEGFVIESNAELPEAPDVEETPSGVPLLPIEDRQFALRRFYRALDRVQGGDPDATVRVLHYGDSLIAGDYVTQTVRRLMQKKFGDGGHGFVLAGRPTRWYRRNNLKLWSSDGWTINRMTNPTIADGLYGLGGMTFRTRSAGQFVRFEPDPGEDSLNAGFSRAQIFYLGQPGGGKFEVDLDGRSVVVDTDIDAVASRLAEVQVADGPHVLRVRTLGGGEVRLFGAVFEREGPGVVYDSLGVDGARAKLLKRMNPPHWHDQLRLRHPDLLILHYGTNESQWRNLSADEFRADLSQTVGHLRQALPGVSCLMVGPMDRAERGNGGTLRTMPVVLRIVRVQREVAFAQGCAFWNTFEAMGGQGSMARWYRHRPQLAGGDLTHPTRMGADRVGAMMFSALMDGYARASEAGY